MALVQNTTSTGENCRRPRQRLMLLLSSLVLFGCVSVAILSASQDQAPGKKEAGKPKAEAQGEKQKSKEKPVAAQPTCCSCVTGLKLVLLHNGPIETPPELRAVDNPEDPGGEKIKVPKRNRPQPGHAFQVVVNFETKPSETQGNLTLHWFERADVLPSMIQRAGAQPDKWYDAQEILTTSQVKVRKADGKDPQPGDKDADLETIADYVKKHNGTATDWVRKYLDGKSKVCPSKDRVYIDDKPAAHRHRKLDFHITVENPKDCECGEPAKLELWATQLLVAKKGESEAGQHLSGLYGPKGKLNPGNAIVGEPPNAPEPKLP